MQYIILGSTPGDGGVVNAKNPKEAIIKFMQASWGSTSKEHKEIRRMVEKEMVELKVKKTGNGTYRWGDYEINER